ncbi:hypothetical protein M153_19763000371, partial [Pseudoloma neurophilia]
MEQNSSNKLLESDMASAAKAIDVFTGKDTEDISLWIKEFEMISLATGLDEQQQACLFVTKLRGVARAWCSELMEARDWQVDIKILKKEIKLS